MTEIMKGSNTVKLIHFIFYLGFSFHMHNFSLTPVTAAHHNVYAAFMLTSLGGNHVKTALLKQESIYTNKLLYMSDYLYIFMCMCV